MEETRLGNMEQNRTGTGANLTEWYHGVNLEEAETFIQANLKSAARSVIAIGYYLKVIRDQEYFRDAGYETIWAYAKDRYGFSMSTASRYMARNDRFSKGGNSPVLDDRYQDFSKAQMQEMLSLDAEQLEEVTPEMTVRQIRELKKPAASEIPYFEIPGQMSLEDFALPDTEAAFPGDREARQPAGSCVMRVEDMLETEAVATSQQTGEAGDAKTAAGSEENAAGTASNWPELNEKAGCPPRIQWCRRTEWETSPEKQAAGSKECGNPCENICSRVAREHADHADHADEKSNLGDLSQAKETYLKRLADVLISQMENRMLVPGELGRLSDETITRKLKILDRENGGHIDIGDGVTAYACEKIIEFYQGDEDLGICSYARYATQVRKEDGDLGA